MPAGSNHRRSRAWFDGWSAGSTWLALSGAALALVVLDQTFPTVGMGPAYIPLIALAGWRLGLGAASAVALTAAFLNIFPHHADEAVQPAVAVARGALRLGTYAFIVATVCALRRLFDRERDVAQRDYLTGAFNRAAFDGQAAGLLSASAAGRRASAVVLIDIDDFKGINDSHGHSAGDDALRALVRTAAANLRRDDCLGRLGGDEFAAVLQAGDIGEARSRAEAFHATISDGLARCEIPITASMGTCIVAPGTHAETVSALQDADRLMYQAKASGPGGMRSGVFDRAAAPDPGRMPSRPSPSWRIS